MTVSSTLRKAGPFNGNGVTTAFPFAFKIFAKTDIEVVKTSTAGVQTALVLDSDYSVALNVDQDASPGGTITYPVAGSPLAAGETLNVVGSLVAQQATDITNLGRFLPQVIEDAFDRLVMLVQQLYESFSRALTAPVGDAASLTLPTIAQRAGRALIFDASGNVAAGPEADVVASAVSAQAAAGSAVLAQNWATKTDAEVAAGQGYGAKKYSQDAGTQAGSATTQAGLAATAKTAAETARDAAVAAGATVGAYPNSGATVVPSGVAVGSGYWVQSADGYTLNRYKNVGGVATADPTVGPLGLQNLQSVGTDTSLQADTEATVDSLGYVGTRLTTQGRLGKIPAVVQPLAYQGKVMHHFLDYGQSLSNGWNAVPPITTSGMFDDVWMFNGGVNTAATSENPAVSMTSITPYFEQVQGSSGETPNGGRVARLVQVLRERHGKSLRGAGLAVLCSSAGKDGLSLANFVKGSTYYTRIINQVTQGKALATAAGYTYRIAGIFFDQGQSDGATAVATYLATLQQIQSDLQTDIRAITGGTETVRFFLTTTWLDTGLAAPYSHPGSTLAQLAAHAADPTKFIIVNPPYQQNTIDGTHWTAFDSGLAGAYGAEAYLEQIIYGGNWNCVEPISFDVTGAVVTIRFACPGGQLVLDTKQARLAANYGFLCTDRTGAAYTISSVALSGTDRVVVTLSGAPASGLRVKYGDFSTQQSTWNYVGPLRRSYGSRGNLRDNSGDLAGGIYRHPSNRYAPMHRWCVQFDSVVIA